MPENRPSIDLSRALIDWHGASEAARDWWNELEGANRGRPDLVSALAQALNQRGASLDDFYWVCAFSNRKGVRENLRLLDSYRQDPPRTSARPSRQSLH